MTTKRGTGAAAMVVLVLVATGCGSSASPGGASAVSTSALSPVSTPAPVSSSPAAPATGTTAAGIIVIKDFAYQVSGSVSPGTMITVRNDDNIAHTVTADSGSAFDVTVPASGTVTFTAPSEPGSYRFHCTYHANMHGVLIVK
jgi:plastocyanin